MLKYKVVLVPFPFDDFSATKVRPAICLTNTIGDYNHLVLAFISSRIPSEFLPTDMLLEKTETDFASTGLRVSSVLRLHRMMTVSTSLIRRELGELSLNQQERVKERLQELFDL